MKNPNDKLANKNFSLRKWFFVGGGGVDTSGIFTLPIITEWPSDQGVSLKNHIPILLFQIMSRLNSNVTG